MMNADWNKMAVTMARTILMQLAPEQLAAMQPTAASTDASPVRPSRANGGGLDTGVARVGVGRARLIAGVPATMQPVYTPAPPKRYRAIGGVTADRIKRLTGNNAATYAAIKAAGKAGISAADVVEATGIKPKSVQSANHQLRTAGLVESFDVRG